LKSEKKIRDVQKEKIERNSKYSIINLGLGIPGGTSPELSAAGYLRAP
jgi:hypothetical protein